VGTSPEERIDCPGCGTPHHPDCFKENGGCTVFGCSSAPVDEPKVTVSGTDLAGNVIRREVPATRPIVLGPGYVTLSIPRGEPASPSAPPAVPPPPPPPLSAGTAPPPPPPPLGQNASYIPSRNDLINYYPTDQPKSRAAFVLLGIFLGVFGVHNFYAGYIQKGVVQLLLTLLTCFYGAIVSWVWAIVEICMISQDRDGVQFT
jgi:TM2 domain-containing membrane protein YozV